MYVLDSSTSEGIPYATYTTGQTGGMADADGYIDDNLIKAYAGNNLTFSAAGYLSKPVAANTAVNLGVELDENGGGLSEVFVIAKKKIKENPIVTVLLIAIIITVIVKRKAIFSMLK